MKSVSFMVDELSACEFEVRLYDLYAETQGELRAHMERLADTLQGENLRGPLYSIVQEIAANALKALYKQVFDRYMIQEAGLEHIAYESWLEIFRVEMQEHHGENFARLCHEKELYITVRGRVTADAFRIEAVNEGEPSDIERVRIRAAIQSARGITGLAGILDGDDPLQEDTSLGIPLVILNLRGIGAEPEAFQVVWSENRTVARVDLPLSLFRGTDATAGGFTGDVVLAELVWDLYRDLDYGLVRFSKRGDVLAVSRNLLQKLNLSSGTASRLRQLLPAAFFSDLFQGPQSVRVQQRFENYRIYLRPAAGQGTETGVDAPPEAEVLFNVSGHLRPDGFVDTLWQQVTLQTRNGRLGEGSITDSMRVHRMIEPYIPRQVLRRAREAVRLGQPGLPEELRELTIFFADLVGFTQKAENMVHHRVMELLNLALGVCVRSIESNEGAIDKFMGDAVMAIFEDPLKAVVAALEIQNYFQQVNELRRISGEEPVHVRIGINTGPVIMGNIGARDRMDYTVVGDVVNTASRIEKSSVMGRVLVGQTTYEKIRDRVSVDGQVSVKVKGKRRELQLYFVDSVRFPRAGTEIGLRLADGPSDEPA